MRLCVCLWASVLERSFKLYWCTHIVIIRYSFYISFAQFPGKYRETKNGPLLWNPLKYILVSKTEAEYISFVNMSKFHLFIWHVILVDKIMTKHMTRQIFRKKAYYITRWLSMQLLQAYCNVLHVRSCLVMYNSHKIWLLSSSALFLDVKLYNGCLQSTI